MAHVSEKKKEVVAEFVDLIDSAPIIGVVDMSNLPAKQLQTMRSKLREKNANLKMTKKRLMKIAFSKSKRNNIKELEQYLKGMPALIFTDENPFKLYSGLEKTKSSAPAKAGQEAPKDITVKAGPTSFAPGPIIGQLGKFGIKTGVEGGKIAIKNDAVVVREGQVISGELAEILTRLGIEPMEIGLKLVAVYEDGTVYSSKVLRIDETEYKNKICTSYSESFNLAVYVAYPTEDTINVLLSKAYTESKSLAVSQNIINAETAADILLKAQAEMMSVAGMLPDEALSDALRSGKQMVRDDKEPEPEAKEEKTEEPKEESDTAVGLGSLFG